MAGIDVMTEVIAGIACFRKLHLELMSARAVLIMGKPDESEFFQSPLESNKHFFMAGFADGKASKLITAERNQTWQSGYRFGRISAKDRGDATAQELK